MSWNGILTINDYLKYRTQNPAMYGSFNPTSLTLVGCMYLPTSVILQGFVKTEILLFNKSRTKEQKFLRGIFPTNKEKHFYQLVESEP